VGRGVAGQDGVSAGGGADEARLGGAENVGEERVADERGEGIRRNEGSVRSREDRREANVLAHHIED
jgi:hypothetical protein